LKDKKTIVFKLKTLVTKLLKNNCSVCQSYDF